MITGFSCDISGAITVVLGSSAPSADVSVYDGEMFLGNTTAGEDGSWTLNINPPLDPGQHSIHVESNGGSTALPALSSTYTISSSNSVNVFPDTDIFKIDGKSLRLEGEASYEFKFAVNVAAPVTVGAYLRKNTSYGAHTDPTITLIGPGIDGTGSAVASGGSEGTWTKLTVTGTPVSDCVLRLKVETFSPEGNASAWIDDISIIW